jgi:hypothetical protein
MGPRTIEVVPIRRAPCSRVRDMENIFGATEAWQGSGGSRTKSVALPILGAPHGNISPESPGPLTISALPPIRDMTQHRLEVR